MRMPSWCLISLLLLPASVAAAQELDPSPEGSDPYRPFVLREAGGPAEDDCRLPGQLVVLFEPATSLAEAKALVRRKGYLILQDHFKSRPASLALEEGSEEDVYVGLFFRGQNHLVIRTGPGEEKEAMVRLLGIASVKHVFEVRRAPWEC